MSNELKNLVRTCATFNRERKPEEPPFKLPADAVATYVYDLLRPLQMLGDEDLCEIESALGEDGPDLELHQRACAIRNNLEALRSLAVSTFYLLPGEGGR